MGKTSIDTLDGKLLRLFLEVYEYNSVSRAAERMGLTQSTVSHGVERLRRALGDPLFIKDGRNIAPTAHADYLAPLIQQALSALETLAEPEEYQADLDTRPVIIAANAHELQSDLTHIYRALAHVAPAMPVRFLQLGSNTNARTILETGQADIAIAVRTVRYPAELDSVPFLSDQMVTFFDGSVRGPLRTPQDYSAARHAALDFGGGRLSLVDLRLGELGVTRKVHLHANNIRLLSELIRGTDLVTTMQKRFAKQELAGFDHCAPPFHLPEVQYDVIWHRRQSLSKRHIWLRTLVLDPALAMRCDPPLRGA